MSQFLDAALEAAKAAEEVILRSYRRNLEVRLKQDKSPVTTADVEAEKAIRRIIESRFPRHGFHGEETGRTAPDAEFLWLVDPIDGTKAFVREYPMFSTQIALAHRGEIIVGVSNAPAYGELAWAERGQGAWLGETPLRVSAVAKFEEAALSTGNLKSLAGSPRWPALGRVVSRLSRIRGYGDFLHYHLLAAGKIDAVIESDVDILDIAALTIIVEEAGGRFTDLDGKPVSLGIKSVMATNGLLHQPLLEALSGA
jgi:histidinol-phosphatase